MTTDRREFGSGAEVHAQRSAWQPMELRYVGEIRELVKGGTGKSGVADDPGDVLKPPGADSA